MAVCTNSSAAADYFVGTKVPVLSVSAAATLTAAQSGSVILVAKAAAYTITLPAPTITGLRFKFIGGAVIANAVTIASPSANTVAGHWIGATPTLTATTNSTSIAFTATSVAGDVIEAVSDGSKWQVSGITGAAAGMAFA